MNHSTMRNLVTIFLLLAPLLSGCTKFGKNITVEGKVYNPITGEGIENVEIKLLKVSNSFPGGFKTVKTTYTDASGNYEISAASIGKRFLSVNHSGDYYSLGWEGDVQATADGYSQVKKGSITHLDYKVAPYGYIIYHVNNLNCQGANDTLQLYFVGSELNTHDAQIGKLLEVYGCINEQDSPVKVPIGDYYYEWVSIKNGVLEEFSDTITVTENGSTTLNVFY